MKLFESICNGGTITTLSNVTYTNNYIELDDDWKYIIINDSKYFLDFHVENKKYRYNFGGIRGLQNTNANFYTSKVNNDILVVIFLELYDLYDYKFDHVIYNKKQYRLK